MDDNEKATAWQVINNGKRISVHVGPPRTRDEALRAARFHWPDCEVAEW